MASAMTINPIGTLYQYIQWNEFEGLAVGNTGVILRNPSTWKFAHAPDAPANNKNRPKPKNGTMSVRRWKREGKVGGPVLDSLTGDPDEIDHVNDHENR